MTEVDKIGPWSREKLELLGEYLKAYTSILNLPKNRRWCKGCYYIDAFAGSVTPFDKESGQHIDGSPRIALKTEPSFDGFMFIDLDKDRIEKKVRPLEQEFCEKSIRIRHGDCNEIIVNEILPYFFKNRGKRGFIFLDPYGLHVRWETVEAIGKSGVFDIFINFSIMGAYRNLGKTMPSEKVRALISAVVGTDDWVREVYKTTEQHTLSPEFTPRVDRRKEVARWFTDFYIGRLKDNCFRHVSRPAFMHAKGGPLYALILASQQEVAVEKMHEIFHRKELRTIKLF